MGCGFFKGVFLVCMLKVQALHNARYRKQSGRACRCAGYLRRFAPIGQKLCGVDEF